MVKAQLCFAQLPIFFQSYIVVVYFFIFRPAHFVRNNDLTAFYQKQQFPNGLYKNLITFDTNMLCIRLFIY
jgi:hypothetical protein